MHFEQPQKVTRIAGSASAGQKATTQQALALPYSVPTSARWDLSSRRGHSHDWALQPALLAPDRGVWDHAARWSSW